MYKSTTCAILINSHSKAHTVRSPHSNTSPFTLVLVPTHQHLPNLIPRPHSRPTTSRPEHHTPRSDFTFTCHTTYFILDHFPSLRKHALAHTIATRASHASIQFHFQFLSSAHVKCDRPPYSRPEFRIPRSDPIPTLSILPQPAPNATDLLDRDPSLKCLCPIPILTFSYSRTY